MICGWLRTTEVLPAGTDAPIVSSSSGTIRLTNKTLASDATRTLLIDRQGRVWVGTQDHGLDLLEPRTGRVHHFRHSDSDPRSLASDAVYALYADRSGQLWIGTDAGLSRYDPAHNDYVNYGAAGTAMVLADPHIRAIVEDHAGNLWIGTLSGGLGRVEASTGRVRSFRHEPTDPSSLSLRSRQRRARGRRAPTLDRNRRRTRPV